MYVNLSPKYLNLNSYLPRPTNIKNYICKVDRWPVSCSLTHLASFVGMACKTWLHSFSFVPILRRRSSTLPAMSHLLNRSSQSGQLFSSSVNRPSPPTTPVHAQAKRGFSSKNDDVAVASRKRAHTLSLSLSLHIELGGALNLIS